MPSEKAMAPHSSTLAWKIPWMEEPGGLQSMGWLRVRQNWAISLSLFISWIGKGNGNPLQCSCLENPRDGGAWWAAVYGVAQSRTRLKRLSSSHDAISSQRVWSPEPPAPHQPHRVQGSEAGPHRWEQSLLLLHHQPQFPGCSCRRSALCVLASPPGSAGVDWCVCGLLQGPHWSGLWNAVDNTSCPFLFWTQFLKCLKQWFPPLAVVQSLISIWLFVTTWTTAHQAPLSFLLTKMCPLSRWCYSASSCSVTSFLSCHQTFSASGSFPTFWLFTSGSPSIGGSASASVQNIQGWFPLRWTGLIYLLSRGLSSIFSSTTVWKYQFFGAQPSLWSNSHIHTRLLDRP